MIVSWRPLPQHIPAKGSNVFMFEYAVLALDVFVDAGVEVGSPLSTAPPEGSGALGGSRVAGDD